MEHQKLTKNDFNAKRDRIAEIIYERVNYPHSHTVKTYNALAAKILRFLDIVYYSDFIDPIATGYEWECPKCDNDNVEDEILNDFECQKCNTIFQLGEAQHAYH